MTEKFTILSCDEIRAVVESGEINYTLMIGELEGVFYEHEPLYIAVEWSREKRKYTGALGIMEDTLFIDMYFDENPMFNDELRSTIAAETGISDIVGFYVKEQPLKATGIQMVAPVTSFEKAAQQFYTIMAKNKQT